MSKADVFQRWAPAGARWTPWVKPVLFAHLDDVEAVPPPQEAPPSWIGPDLVEPMAEELRSSEGAQHPYRKASAMDDVAVVVDLPGARSALAGVALAAHGFRPVPLYNAIPASHPIVQIVDSRPIMAVLRQAADSLPALRPEAPPAFLLDADRMGRGHPVAPGFFDNRSVSFTTDFPSASALRGAGIRRAVLLQHSGLRPAVDLAETLIDWQGHGIELFVKQASVPGPPVRRTITRAFWLWRLIHAIRSWSFSRNPDGSFGARIPLQLPSAG
jgi:hypothetical protein